MASSQTENKYDRVYMYPKSSCDCYQCTYRKFEFPKGKPTNLSVPDCKVSDHFECYDRHTISTHIEPQDKSGISYINPEVYSKSYSQSFAIQPNCYKGDSCNTCPEIQFGSWDPRTWSATHNQYLTFDRPPLESTPKLKNIYDKDMKGYGQSYGTYNDITAGNIIYYTDKSREDAYYKPLFSQPVEVSTNLYQDPMGAIKPEYPRTIPYENPMTSPSCDVGENEYCLSFIKDTQRHREDILSAQMAKRNSQRWMPRWADRDQ